MMDMLTKDELKKFSEKLSYNSRKKFSIDETAEIVNRFIKPHSGLYKQLSDKFSQTKISFLKICLNNNNPSERWEKCKILLNVFMEEHSRLINSHNLNMENYNYLISLIENYIKTVVFFNAQETKHPEGVDFVPYPKDFPDYSLDHFNGVTLKLYSKDKVVIGEKYFNDADFDQLSKEYYSSYSLLNDKQTNKHHTVEHNKFYKEFNTKYPDISKSYKLSSSMKPKEILDVLTSSEKVKFLQNYTNSNATEYQWENKELIYWDFNRIIKDYFPEIKDSEEIEGINFQYLGFKPYEFLVNEKKLLFDLMNFYINKLSLYDKKNYLVALQKYMKGFTLFELESFRNLVREYADRGHEEGILEFLKKIKSDYFNEFKDTEQSQRLIEYIKIYKLIEKGFNHAEAYNTVEPGINYKTMAKRFERCKKDLEKQGIDTGKPEHIQILHNKYKLPEILRLL